MARLAGKSGGKKRRRPRQQGRAVVAVDKRASPKGWLSKFALPAIALAVAAAGVVLSVGPAFDLGPSYSDIGASNASFSKTPVNTDFEFEPETLDELLALPQEDLEQVDIARMNLLCATGLPGSEGLDVEASLDKLDHWATMTALGTDNSLPDFHRNPGEFKHSEAKFRALLIISVTQLEFGVHYNDEAGRNVDFSDARNPFIHGMLNHGTGGTCASMPVIYTAVARRLGYPVDLVLAKTHIFGRWDGTEATGTDEDNPAYGERFNIEGTNPMLSDHPDSYYRSWPEPIYDDELDWYMKNLDAAETLAVFMSIRGAVLMDHGRFIDAVQAYSQAKRLAPHDPLADQRLGIAYHAQAMKDAGQQMAAFPQAAYGVVPSAMLPGAGLTREGVDPIEAMRMVEVDRLIAEQTQRMQGHWGGDLGPSPHQMPLQPMDPLGHPQPGIPPYHQPYPGP